MNRTSPKHIEMETDRLIEVTKSDEMKMDEALAVKPAENTIQIGLQAISNTEIETDWRMMEFLVARKRIADEALEKIKLNMDACRKNFNQLIIKRHKVEFDLETQQQCKALVIQMSLLYRQSATELQENWKSEKSVEESIEKQKNVLKEMDVKLQILKKEGAYLSEDLEEVEKSHVKMMQTFEALKF